MAAIARVVLLILAGAALSEGLLRAGGALLLRDGPPRERGEALVLCLGDSYTYGGALPDDKTYPSFLGRLLAERAPGAYEVVNAGVCEADTSKVLERFEESLPKRGLSKVIVLAGTSNFFGYRQGPAGGFLSDLRVYKLLGIAWVNASSWLAALRADAGGGGDRLPFAARQGTPAPGSEGWYSARAQEALGRRAFAEARGICSEGLAAHPESVNLNYLMSNLVFSDGDKAAVGRFLFRALDAVERLPAASPSDPGLDAAKGLLYARAGDFYIVNFEFRTALEWILKGFGYPGLTEYDVYILKQAYALQNTLDSEGVRRRLEGFAAARPLLARDARFATALAYFRDQQEHEAAAAAWLRRDLEAIVGKARGAGAEVFLMTYPYPYTRVNAILRAVAGDRKVPLIDLEKHFEKARVPGKIDGYFMDTDHLTELGNRDAAMHIMAEAFGRGRRSLP